MWTPRPHCSQPSWASFPFHRQDTEVRSGRAGAEGHIASQRQLGFEGRRGTHKCSLQSRAGTRTGTLGVPALSASRELRAPMGLKEGRQGSDDGFCGPWITFGGSWHGLLSPIPFPRGWLQGHSSV